MNLLFLIVIVVLLIGFGISFYFLRRYYEQRLEREIFRAQKSEQLKSVFLDNASHTLRTPLNAILGYSNLILEEKDDNMDAAQVKEMTNHIKTHTEQLIGFVRQLADLSSFEGGMPFFTLIQVNLAELMASYRREAMNITKPEVVVRVKTDLSPHCKATLDTNFMHQLMMHLLTNAAKHASHGEIIIRYGNERRGLKVTITYMGNGQAEMLSEDIFSFLQKEEALNMTNVTSDLGLPISKTIVEALGGELDIETDNGRKTVASFWYPCRMVDRHKNM
jgi:K+-sensing histidine kinase KdpD